MDSSKKGKSPHERYHIPNVKRCLSILELLSRKTEPMSITDIAKEVSISKGSAFRLVCTLDDTGYLDKIANGAQFKYILSYKLALLGNMVSKELNIVKNSKDILEDISLEFGETAMIGTMVGSECIVIQQALSRSAYKITGEIGMKIRLHAAAPGKILLAYMPKETMLEKINSIDFIKFNDHTITDKDAFIKELAQVKENGFAIDDGEENSNVFCIGVPILKNDIAIAAIWITGPQERMKCKNIKNVAARMAEYASRISSRLKI